MNRNKRKLIRLFGLALTLAVFMGFASTSTIFGQTSVPDDDMLIFYRLNSTETCGTYPPMPLGEFIKRTLSWEIQEAEGDAWDEDALKANAIASRTFTISPYKADKYLHSDGQYYHCTHGWAQEGFPIRRTEDFATLQAGYPNIFNAVDATEDVIMTHADATTQEIAEGWPTSPKNLRFGAIEASYKSETGGQTLGIPDRAWLKSVYDPVSSGIPQSGMGQHGSKRWAWGEGYDGKEYPKWDYRRILAHYYSEVVFVGITNPDPPEIYRSNMLQIEGIPDQGGFTMRKGEERTGIRVLYQNVGTSSWPVNFVDAQGLCPTGTTYFTLLSYHLYHSDGSGPVCGSGCVGIRRTPMCQSDLVISKGEHHWVNGFHVFIPDHPAIISGQTYLLRFDVEHRYASVWEGYSSFDWPPQDIPVTIDTPSGGGGGDEPGVAIVDHAPAVVTYGDLDNDTVRFSWEGINEPDNYDVQYRSKEVFEATFPTTWVAPGNLQGLHPSVTEIPMPISCQENGKDWQFRLRAHKDTQTSDWVYTETQVRTYPWPWSLYSRIGSLAHDSEPGPWNRPNYIINFGGGTFDWTAVANQNWITPTASGQGEGPLDVTISKPGGVGTYYGNITVNGTNPVPNQFCEGDAAKTTVQLPVDVVMSICDPCKIYYLPILFKDSN